MTRTMRILTFLMLAVVVGTGQTWGRGGLGYIVFDDSEVTNKGEVTFYTDANCEYAIDFSGGRSGNLTSSDLTAVMDGENNIIGYTVYIKAVPNYNYTFGAADDNGAVTFITAEQTTNIFQAPRRTQSDPTINVGHDIAVKATDKRYVYSFVMPANGANVTVHVNFPEKPKNTAAVSYIDADGTTKTLAANTAYIIDGTESKMGTSNTDTWYVCTGDVAYTSSITLGGDVNLILADGCQMSATTISGSASQLTIYAQTGGQTGGQTGQMVATAYECGVAFGQRFVVYNAATGTAASAIVSGSNSDANATFTLDGIAGKTLRPLDGNYVIANPDVFTFSGSTSLTNPFTITTGEGENETTTHYYICKKDDPVTLSYAGSDFVMLSGLPEGTTLAAVKGQPMQRTFTMPATDVALTATAVTDLTATDIIYGEATPEIKQGDDVFATANYAFVYKSGDEVITEPTVGTYTCTLTGLGQYFGTTNVAIKVKPRPITIAAGSATKKYDGTPLTSPYYECTVIPYPNMKQEASILIDDSIAGLTITGSQTNPGSSVNVPSNAVITRRGDATVDITFCYDITYCNGTLEVRTNDRLITVIPGSGSKYYDGTPLTMTAHDDFEVTASDDFEVTGFPEALTWEATADGIVTNVTPGEGEKSENAVTSFKIFDANHLDVTNYFTNIDKDQVGTLTILPRQTTIAVEIVDPETTIDGHPLIISGDDAHVKVTLNPVKAEGETTELPTINGIVTLSVNDGINEPKPYNVAIVNGVGHYYVANLAQDAYDITASFAGDANHDESTSATTTLEVCKILTEITCSLNKTSINVGESLDVTVKINEVGLQRPVIDEATNKKKEYKYASSTPLSVDAVVTIKAGTEYDRQQLEIIPNYENNNYTFGFTGGQGTKIFSHLPAGTRYFRAVYAGDEKFTQSECQNKTLIVNKKATTIGVDVTSPVIAK